MKAGWIIGLITLYIILTPVFGMIDNTFTPAPPAGTTAPDMNAMLVPPIDSSTNVLGIAIAAISTGVAWLGEFFKILTFGYACLTGTWVILRLLLCAISIGIIGSIIISMITSRTN
jgi:hypothetical protein